KLLNLHEVRGHTGSEFLACGVHEINRDNLALDQVIVEMHRLPFVSLKFDVWEPALPRPVVQRTWRCCCADRGSGSSALSGLCLSVQARGAAEPSKAHDETPSH